MFAHSSPAGFKYLNLIKYWYNVILIIKSYFCIDAYYEEIEESTASDFADAVLNSAKASRRVEGTRTRMSYCS